MLGSMPSHQPPATSQSQREPLSVPATSQQASMREVHQVSAARISQSQPQGPAFQSQPAKSTKPAATKPAKPTKSTKAATSHTPRLMPSGIKAECQVLLKSGKPCSNPWNHTQPRLGVMRGTCSTHKNKLDSLTPQGLAAIRYTKAIQEFDPTLWHTSRDTKLALVKATKPTKPATKAASQPATKAATKPATKPASQPASQPEALAATSQPA